MRSTRYSKGAVALATCALVLVPAGAAFAGGPGAGEASAPSDRAARSTAPSPAGNPVSKEAKAAGVCSDAVEIGTKGLIKRNGATIASVKQFYSAKCKENYGYLWVWDSFRNTAAPYDVSVGVYDYSKDTTHGKQDWKATKQQEFWSGPADTVSACTAAVGTLRPAGSPQPFQAYSSKRC